MDPPYLSPVHGAAGLSPVHSWPGGRRASNRSSIMVTVGPNVFTRMDEYFLKLRKPWAVR
jgi:hypothetical protein